VALFALLSLKAGREEGFLRDKHGEWYRAYAADVPQFFPTLPAIKSFVLGSD
jgi:protein-S-isoprenylcysteine O-methyltransferase Ste14